VNLYPRYLADNPNVNSFPSQSTALYAVVAAGIYSLRKDVGLALWLAVGFLVALSRMYVGGHYISDVLVGLLSGLGGYLCARRFLESRLGVLADRVFRKSGWQQVLGQALVFAWILQVAVEFRDAVWVKDFLIFIFGRALKFLL
jgi:hypothetical protein